MENYELLTIRETAKKGPLKEHTLRAMLREGRLPGIYSGSRFYIHYPKLLEQIEKEVAESVK